MDKMNKEIRIDVTKQTEEELALANTQAQLIFRFNQTMPGTAEYVELMHRIFPSMGENSRVGTPLTAVRPHNVSIGDNAVVGAASVVTNDVAPNTIVAGNPAKLIKVIPPKS